MSGRHGKPESMDPAAASESPMPSRNPLAEQVRQLPLKAQLRARIRSNSGQVSADYAAREQLFLTPSADEQRAILAVRDSVRSNALKRERILERRTISHGKQLISSWNARFIATRSMEPSLLMNCMNTLSSFGRSRPTRSNVSGVAISGHFERVQRLDRPAQQRLRNERPLCS